MLLTIQLPLKSFLLFLGTILYNFRAAHVPSTMRRPTSVIPLAMGSFSHNKTQEEITEEKKNVRTQNKNGKKPKNSIFILGRDFRGILNLQMNFNLNNYEQ